jgi:hypothetical protein
MELFEEFETLNIKRLFHNDKLLDLIVIYLKSSFGEEIMATINLDIRACLEESNHNSPLLFILSQGSDPMG